MKINLFGPFYGMKAVAPLMRESGGGSIVNISSIAGNFAQWGIRVNSVHPGLVGTALLGGANDFVAASLKSVPFGRMGTLDEITEAVLFLLSNSSTYTTGTELTVDGGTFMTEHWDVVVIGGGGAGLAAAVSAAEEGASVLLFESETELGGSTALSAGIFTAAGTSVQAGLGVDDSAEKFFQHYMDLNQW
eukprot:gene28480-34588_t